jgi:hypothetical protein
MMECRHYFGYKKLSVELTTLEKDIINVNSLVLASAFNDLSSYTEYGKAFLRQKLRSALRKTMTERKYPIHLNL